MSSSYQTEIEDKKKKALIIGNNNYENFEQLHLSENDAQLMKSTLEKLGFTTQIYLNQTNDQIKLILDDFGEEVVQENDTIFFYYSGHTSKQYINNSMENYLFGVDAEKKSDGTINGVGIDRWVFHSFYKDSVYLIMIDGCRIRLDSKEQYKIKAGQLHPADEVSEDGPDWTLAPVVPPQDRQFSVLVSSQPGFYAIEKVAEQFKNGYLADAFKSMCGTGSWGEIVTGMIKQIAQQTNLQQIPQNLGNISKDYNL